MTIVAYLDELCGSLEVEPLRRDEIRLEAHVHLLERAESLQREGLPREAAEERAVQEFGEPSEVAARLSAARGSLSLPRMAHPVDILAVVLAATGAMSLCTYLAPLALPGFWKSGGPYGTAEHVTAALSAGAAAAQLGLSVALFRHRRWVRLPLVLGAAGAAILSLLAVVAALHPSRRLALNLPMLENYLPALLLSAYTLWVLLSRRRSSVLES